MNTPLRIVYHDLLLECRAGALAQLIGRREELARLDRVVSRRMQNNALIVGAGGSGKTALIYGLAAERSRTQTSEIFIQCELEWLSTDIGSDEELRQAADSLPSGIIFFDGLGRILQNVPTAARRFEQFCLALLRRPTSQIIVAMEPAEYNWLLREHSSLTRFFEVLTLKAQPAVEYAQMLARALPRLNAESRRVVHGQIFKSIVSYVERFPALGALPSAGVVILDECIAAATQAKQAEVTEALVRSVVAAKTGIPIAQLTRDEIATLGQLETELNSRIISQKQSIKKIATTMQRAKLGMRNPNRPLGSFLVLGPSGVGKTETAKLMAQLLFGRAESFIRFDMSEFGQEHTVQRLIGAPAGYIGYEAGGALTQALKQEPHSLILLDEIEKAHAKVFDIFLQVLDDGRLTSGQNETVDAKNTVIMATSNIGVSEILAAVERKEDIHSPQFLQSVLLPTLGTTFRMEFLNRFDSILVFNPLGLSDLVRIAQLEIRKVERRLAHHRVRFTIDDATLTARVAALADPRLGARPIRRFIEEACETLVMRSIFATDTPVASGTTLPL